MARLVSLAASVASVVRIDGAPVKPIGAPAAVIPELAPMPTIPVCNTCAKTAALPKQATVSNMYPKDLHNDSVILKNFMI